MDKEYAILSIIESKKDITQRELSKKVGISLGSINIIINKMIKEGFIRIKHRSDRKKAYIITQKGIQEKEKKTLELIKDSYSFIQRIKEKISEILHQELQVGLDINIIVDDDEIGQLIRSIAGDFANIKIGMTDHYSKEMAYIVVNSQLYERLKSEDCHVINILSKL